MIPYLLASRFLFPTEHSQATAGSVVVLRVPMAALPLLSTSLSITKALHLYIRELSWVDLLVQNIMTIATLT